MPQISLNDPIDGAELKLIILARIKEALDRDCTLANDIAYAGFNLTFEIRLKYLRSKTEGTLVWGAVMDTSNVKAEAEIFELAGATPDIVTDSYTSDSPNQAREDHALPIPVMIQTPNGPERRKIHVNPARPKSTPKPIADAPPNTP